MEMQPLLSPLIWVLSLTAAGLFAAVTGILALRQRELDQRLRLARENRSLQARALLAERRIIRLAQRHDRQLRSSWAEVLDLLEADNPDAARRALDQMSRRQLEPVRRYADNPAADTALTGAACRCEEQKIRFSVTGTLPAADPIAGPDLASLLWNLLSNAVEGALAAGAEGRTDLAVSVQLSFAMSRLIIRVQNTAASQVRLGGTSSKPRPEEHGFGTRIIRRIVRRYHGRYTLRRQKDATVVAEVELLTRPL